MTWAALVFVVVAAATILLGWKTDLLRDNTPADFAPAVPAKGEFRRTYSLAQTQMAWWFCIIIASYVYIWSNQTTAGPILNSGALVLLGIGTGTALGAAIIEQTKTGTMTTLNAFNLAVMAQNATPSAQNLALVNQLAQKLASINFFDDILTDVNGICLHRFQTLAWTFVLGVIFLADVLKNDAMPVFDSTTLAVLGISGGTYLGFKIPEQPS